MSSSFVYRGNYWCQGGGDLTFFTHLACQLAVLAHISRTCSTEEIEIFTTCLLFIKTSLLICREKKKNRHCQWPVNITFQSKQHPSLETFSTRLPGKTLNALCMNLNVIRAMRILQASRARHLQLSIDNHKYCVVIIEARTIFTSNVPS